MQKTDYAAIVKNAEYFKKLLDGKLLCAVVKNDAYGHGLVRTACALCGIADYFAVGSLAEAQKISSFSKNILILLPVFDCCADGGFCGNFILTVDSFETLDRILRFTPRGKKTRVHIKLETGMNRLGFKPEELEELAVALENPKLSVEGVFSHFYADTEKLCDEQLKIFNYGTDMLVSRLKKPLIRHIANTSGVLLSKKYHLDMARVGLGLYGYGSDALTVAKSVTAKVLAVQNVKGGQCVSYGGEYIFPKDTRVAVIGVGYGNGFARALKHSSVKINGKLFPVVGNVCMAMCMAEIGDASVNVGDEALLHGEGLNNANSDVIVYELLCNLK